MAKIVFDLNKWNNNFQDFFIFSFKKMNEDIPPGAGLKIIKFFSLLILG